MLEQEGVTIMIVEKLRSKWLTPLAERCKEVMTKIRLWELVQYDRVPFLDVEKFLLKLIGEVFDDPGAQPRKTLQNYSFTSHPEALHAHHTYSPADWSNFDAGFLPHVSITRNVQLPHNPFQYLRTF
jgi:alpha-N-acetylglucosamine transferase